MLLAQAGLQTASAENGQECVELAARERFDLILMDMQMPVMDGPTATRMLRQSGITTPIYALTANAMQGFERECLDAGCNGFLTKPIDIDLLYATIAKELAGDKFVEEVPSFKPETAADPHEDSEIDSGPLYSTLPDDPEFRSIIVEFIEHLEERLAEMEMALGASDFDSLAKLAHWLKGSGGSLGFGDFTLPAKAFETAAKDEDLESCEQQLGKITAIARRICLKPEPANEGKVLAP